MKLICVFLSLVAISLTSCKQNSDKPEIPPVKADLVFPLKNQACIDATAIDQTHSTIEFNWNSSANTDNYHLVITDLNTGTDTTKATDRTILQVTLKRNTPYSWYVISKSSRVSETAKSDVWKFYNPGPGAESYSPYPAELVYPSIGAQVKAVNGKITLAWNGSDADADITGYDVYLGTGTSPVLLKSNLTVTQLADVNVSADTTYYWKVVTKDSNGNKSDSGTYQFRVSK
jgi:hypothetical protein